MLFALGACSRPEARPSGAAAAAPPHERPKSVIVVSVVVDQLAAWVLTERLPLLRPEGGFARLVKEGTWVRELRFAHAVCDTAPGHAALYTGAPPRDTGVFANEVFDANGDKVSILADVKTVLVDAFGVRTGETGSSISLLRVPTVGDELRKAHPDAVIVALSLKDRGAIFGAGRAPTDVVWYDSGKGSFVTSTAFTSAPPPWLEASWRLDHQPLLRVVWDAPLRPDWVRVHALSQDAEPGEGDWLGLGVSFPHAPLASPSPMKAVRATPVGDRLLFAMALRALDARHAGEHPTLLSLSLSSNDYIGHTFGPDSWEAWDELDRLDVELGKFLGALDARFGADGWALTLSADHGITSTPESAPRHPWCAHPETDRWSRTCDKGERLLPAKLADELQAAATKAIGPGKWITGIAEPYVVLGDAARGLPPSKQAQLTKALEAALLAHPGVARVLGDAPGTCPPERDEGDDALFCRSRLPGSGHGLYVVTKPGSFFDAGYPDGAGTSHGSARVFDRAVPLIVRAPGKADAGKIVEGPVTYRAHARTLSALLGIAPPAAAADAPSFAK